MAIARHSGRVAIVTGAAIGNGQAFAAMLAEEGAQVVLADIVEARETIGRIRAIEGALEPLMLNIDVTSEEATKEMARTVKEKFGRIDILINNAGIYDEDPFELLTLESWKRIMDVNLTGIFLTSKAVLPIMKQQQHGRIINMSSDTVWLGTPYLVHYAASKMGVIGFTRALATEVGKYGITVNAITLGLTATQRPAGGKLSQGAILSHVLPPQAIERAETPEEIAAIVSFLASTESAIITGQTINADGGVARH